MLIIADGISFADIAGAEMLASEARRRQREGGGLYLVGVKQRTLEMLRTGSWLAIIGEENVFETKGSAIAQTSARLDKGLCANCDRRTFEECRRAS